MRNQNAHKEAYYFNGKHMCIVLYVMVLNIFRHKTIGHNVHLAWSIQAQLETLKWACGDDYRRLKFAGVLPVLHMYTHLHSEDFELNSINNCPMHNH